MWILSFSCYEPSSYKPYSSVVQDVLEASQKRLEAMGDVRREQKLGEVSPFVGPVDKSRAVQKAQTRQVSQFVGPVDES